MALFVITWTDKPDSLQVRMAARENHLAYVRNNPGVVRLGGPFLDQNGDMAGSLMIVEAESLDAARAFHEADPYKKAGLFEASQVKPWRVTIGSIG